jgi:hypothetical protein
MGSLSNLYISQSYQSLAHLGTNNALVPGTMNQLQDGIGQSLNISFDGTNISSSGNIFAANITASSYVTETESGSFLITASFDTGSRNLTFTKGNNGTFAVNIPDVSGSTFDTGSFATTGSNTFTGLNVFNQQVDLNNAGGLLFYPYNNQILSAVGVRNTSGSFEVVKVGTASKVDLQNLSLLVSGTFTSSLQQGYVWVGNASGITTTVATSSFGGGAADLTSLNAFTASQETKDTTLASVTSSFNSATASLFTSASLSLTTASFSGNTLTFTKGNGTTFGVVIPDVSGSSIPTGTISGSAQITALGFVSSSVTASSLVTASFAGNTLTFTKGDTTTFGVVIPDISGSAGTTIFEVVYTGENITKGDPLYISGSQGANPIVFKADAADPNKMPVTFVSNETIGVSNTTNAIVLGLIEGINLTGYIAGQSIYVAEGGGWSANLPSGSNSVTQLLGVVTKGGNGGKGLVLNPGPAQLPGLDTGYLWAGNGSNQPIEITTASFASSASFNSYTSSNDQKVNSLIVRTGSYATTGSNTFEGNQTINGGITLSGSLGLTYIDGGATVIQQVTALGNYQTLYDGGLLFQTDGVNNYEQTIATTLSKGLTVNSGSALNNGVTITGGFTASLQQGYAWVGNASGVTMEVPTSSFGGGGSINTGSFATTGSNTFTGDQTLIDNAGNFFTISDASGSMMLVAKTFTSASAHLSGSGGNQVNLIFKNNNNTADTIISGSNNIFVNPAAPTAGFKRYLGLGNIALNASNVPQISGSMAFSPNITTNYFGGNAATLTMRGPVSSSTYTIAGNNILGAINIGSSAANNAEKAVAGMNISTNSINGTLSFIANRSILTQNSQIINNVITSATLTAASSSILYANNIGNITITNSVSGSATSVSIGSNAISINANNFNGIGNAITAIGSADPGDTSGASYLRHFESNAMFGSQNGVNLPNAATGSNSLSATLIAGYGLGITGSNASTLTAFTGTNNGSAFFGRYNALDGNRAQSAQTIFAVGTGTSTSNRKTGFLIDSGSNTFIEGTLNVSGSTTMTGSLILSSSAAIELQVIGNSVFTGSAFGNVVALSIASNTASMDLNLGNYFTLTLADTATTHISASNVQPGVSATLVITTGTNSSASLAPTMLQPSGSAYSATNGSAKKDILSIVAVASGVPFVVSTKNMI